MILKTEFNIPGYTLFVSHRINRLVVIYTHISLNAQLFNALNKSEFWEFIWCQFNTLNNSKVLLRCIYKSPKTTEQNEKITFSLFELANKSIYKFM